MKKNWTVVLLKPPISTNKSTDLSIPSYTKPENQMHQMKKNCSNTSQHQQEMKNTKQEKKKKKISIIDETIRTTTRITKQDKRSQNYKLRKPLHNNNLLKNYFVLEKQNQNNLITFKIEQQQEAETTIPFVTSENVIVVSEERISTPCNSLNCTTILQHQLRESIGDISIEKPSTNHVVESNTVKTVNGHQNRLIEKKQAADEQFSILDQLVKYFQNEMRLESDGNNGRKEVGETNNTSQSSSTSLLVDFLNALIDHTGL